MAPRNRRSKVGLTRMHAALDAMRPMGFSANVVRKCLKNLLKVYGDDGWAFIEEAAYKLLIDTILEEPEVLQLEHKPENLQLCIDSHRSCEEQEAVHEMHDKVVICEEKIGTSSDVHEADAHDEDVNVGQQKSRDRDLDVEVTPVTPMPLEVVSGRSRVGVQLGFAKVQTPHTTDCTPTIHRRKPCYGWISDDEDDDLMQLNPANSIDN